MHRSFGIRFHFHFALLSVSVSVSLKMTEIRGIVPIKIFHAIAPGKTARQKKERKNFRF